MRVHQHIQVCFFECVPHLAGEARAWDLAIWCLCSVTAHMRMRVDEPGSEATFRGQAAVTPPTLHLPPVWHVLPGTPLTAIRPLKLKVMIPCVVLFGLLLGAQEKKCSFMSRAPKLALVCH